MSGETLPTLEARMEDVRTIMDAAAVERAILLGVEDGAAYSLLFAATYPERTAGIVTFGAASRGLADPAAPWLWPASRWDEWIAKVDGGWGSQAFGEEVADMVSPSRAHDRRFKQTFTRLMRHSMSRGSAVTSEQMYRDTDVRHLLPMVQAPTLVIHASGDLVEPIEEGRYLAAHIPGATLVELPSDDHWWPTGLMLAAPEVERFLRSIRDEEAEFDRVLATVLFTDIVGSTERAAQLGDRAWGELLDQYEATVRALLGRYRGQEVDTAGDGFLATFDGPARAIRCAQAIVEAMRSLGLEVRAGVHTGEIETTDDDVRGVAVHIGARVAAAAGPSEVWTSSTVKDLTVGSDLRFEDAGEHPLKGVPDRWHLYRVVD